MTDQRPTPDETPGEIPEPVEWKPEEHGVETSGTSENSITLPDFVPQSFKEAMEHYGPQVVDYQGQVFPVVNKNDLLHTPFMVLDWVWNQNETGDYVSLRIIDAQDRKWCINDGGTGIPRQVKEWESAGYKHGVMCKHGLRKSDYIATVKRVDNKTGELKTEKTEATTWYIA